MFYFAVTTLTTVGFGDYRPYSSWERVWGSLFLFGGVLTFSYFIGNFLEIIKNLDLVYAENEEADSLSRFFGILQKYNQGHTLKKSFITELEDYFEFYWENDRLYGLSTEGDMRIFDELDNRIKNEIFKNFLFRPFIQTFHNFFELRKNTGDPQIKHSYYKWIDDDYSEFMIQIMKYLKPRRYVSG